MTMSNIVVTSTEGRSLIAVEAATSRAGVPHDNIRHGDFADTVVGAVGFSTAAEIKEEIAALAIMLAR